MPLPALAPAVVAFATPLVLAAIGELVVERAGVVNIGIEGMMLAGALGAWLGDVWHGPLAGIAGGVVAAALLALPFALATLGFRADQIVTGTGVNLLAVGLTGIIARRVERAWPGAEPAPVDARWLVALTPVVAVGAWAFLRFTRGGLELTAIGESPKAADTAGVPVNRRKLYAILFGAACAGLAGAFLSIMQVRAFRENMTDGVGFLALALVIFGRWHAGGVVAAGLFFGLLRALANHLETRSGLGPMTVGLFKMLPYGVSLLALAGAGGRSGAPAALGRPYARE